MSIIKVKGMFWRLKVTILDAPVYELTHLDHQQPSCLIDIYYFCRSVLKVTEPWAINPSRNTTSAGSDWLIVTIVPNVLKSFSALHSKCFSSMETFSSRKIDNRKQDCTRDFERGCVCRL